MSERLDLVVRGGTIVDGSGGEPFEADILVSGGRIVAIEPKSVRSGVEEIDARGRIVTPGFVDLHTHYDGQATWDSRLAPPPLERPLRADVGIVAGNFRRECDLGMISSTRRNRRRRI